jgi:hypothetical protein
MQQDEQVFRYEVNRNVRMVLIRHDAELSRIDYSFIGNTVYLDGDLVKVSGNFSVQEIEALASEVSALPHVQDIQFNLSNWIVTSSGDSWKITRTGKSVTTVDASHQAGTLDDATIVIGNAGKLMDVLKDIKKDSKKEE